MASCDGTKHPARIDTPNATREMTSACAKPILHKFPAAPDFQNLFVIRYLGVPYFDRRTAVYYSSREDSSIGSRPCFLTKLSYAVL